MKRFFAVLLAVCMLSFVGCTCSGVISYANANRYSSGGFTYEADKITSIDVEWSAGDVTLKNGSGKLSVSESGGDSLKEADRLHWWIDGSILRIRYCKSGRLCTVNASEKHLVIELPVNADVSVKIASGRINSEGVLDLAGFTVQTASGGMDVDTLTAAAVKIQSASGALKLGSVRVSGSFTVDTASGGLSVESVTADSVSINSASGGVALGLGAVNGVDIDSVSGGVTLRLADPERGAQIKLEAVSGKMNVKLPAEISGNTYTIGSGECRIHIKVVSGNVTVE